MAQEGQRSSPDQEAAGSIPVLGTPHAEESLGNILKPQTALMLRRRRVSSAQFSVSDKPISDLLVI